MMDLVPLEADSASPQPDREEPMTQCRRRRSLLQGNLGEVRSCEGGTGWRSHGWWASADCGGEGEARMP